MSGREIDRNKRKVTMRITGTENLKKARAMKLALFNPVVVEAVLAPISVQSEPTLVPALPEPTIVPTIPEQSLAII